MSTDRTQLLCAMLGVGLSVAIAESGFAHHSPAMYDMKRQIFVEGTVKNVRWSNPHVSFTLDTTDEDGTPRELEIEVLSVSEVSALGLTREMIAPGERLVVRVHPGRQGRRAYGVDIQMRNGTVQALDTTSALAVTPVATEPAETVAGVWVPMVEDFNALFYSMNEWPYNEATLREFVDTREWGTIGICEDMPPPLLGIFPEYRDIRVDGDVIRMHFEAQGQNQERVVHMNLSEHPAGLEPTLMGHSIGRWEEDGTLVVDTVAFSEHPMGIVIDVPSGPDKHMVERLALIDGGRQLRYDVRLEDPARLKEPGEFSMRWNYRPDLKPTGVQCDPSLARRIMEDL